MSMARFTGSSLSGVVTASDPQSPAKVGILRGFRPAYELVFVFMEAPWLASQLESGRSIESIARETGKSASTVAYWVNKHGLTSQHAQKHAARGGIDRVELEAMVALGMPLRAMAEQLGVSYTTVRHWLKRYDLATSRGRRLAGTREMRDAGAETGVADCPVHGPARHVRRKDGGVRCLACRSDAVSARRRRVKALLVAEAGGRCVLCGYGDNIGALHFHHVDPATKAFALGNTGVTRSLAKARAEAAKCVLLCARCHAEVELGVKRLPFPPMTHGEAAA
jgi:transposase